MVGGTLRLLTGRKAERMVVVSWEVLRAAAKVALARSLSLISRITRSVTLMLVSRAHTERILSDQSL